MTDKPLRDQVAQEMYAEELFMAVQHLASVPDVWINTGRAVPGHEYDLFVGVYEDGELKTVWVSLWKLNDRINDGEDVRGWILRQYERQNQASAIRKQRRREPPDDSKPPAKEKPYRFDEKLWKYGY